MTVCVCCLGTFMVAVDTTVVYLALPLTGRGLHRRLVAGRLTGDGGSPRRRSGSLK